MDDTPQLESDHLKGRGWLYLGIAVLLFSVLGFALLVGLFALQLERAARQPTVRLVITWSGASTTEVDEIIAAEVERASHDIEASEWFLISADEICEVYAIGRSGSDPDEFAASVGKAVAALSGHFPREVTIGVASVVAEQAIVPNVDLTESDKLRFTLDSDALKRYGLSAAEVREQLGGRLQFDVDSDAARRLTQAAITNDSGETFQLGSIAKITKVREPSHKIRRLSDPEPVN